MGRWGSSHSWRNLSGLGFIVPMSLVKPPELPAATRGNNVSMEMADDLGLEARRRGKEEEERGEQGEGEETGRRGGRGDG